MLERNLWIQNSESRIRPSANWLSCLNSLNAVLKVRGLCGTLTWNQHDDFTTPEGDVESSVASFAGKYTTEHCAVPSGAPPDPCTTYTQRRQYAETVCSVIHGPVFQVCGVECLRSFFPLVIVTRITLCGFVGMSRRGGEGALFPSLSVRGLRMSSPKDVPLHHPHCLHPPLRSRGCCRPMAQPHPLP